MPTAAVRGCCSLTLLWDSSSVVTAGVSSGRVCSVTSSSMSAESPSIAPAGEANSLSVNGGANKSPPGGSYVVGGANVPPSASSSSTTLSLPYSSTTKVSGGSEVTCNVIIRAIPSAAIEPSPHVVEGFSGRFHRTMPARMSPQACAPRHHGQRCSRANTCTPINQIAASPAEMPPNVNNIQTRFISSSGADRRTISRTPRIDA